MSFTLTVELTEKERQQLSLPGYQQTQLPGSQPRFQQQYSNNGAVIQIVDIQSGDLIGTATNLTFSVTREMAPVYVMGTPDARSFSRGRRGIAGSMDLEDFRINEVFADQVPPFDIVISYGNQSITLYNVELLNEGSRMTIGEANTQRTVTFVASDQRVRPIRTYEASRSV